jgi:tetratricopeptide (TPR) repeat protein
MRCSERLWRNAVAACVVALAMAAGAPAQSRPAARADRNAAANAAASDLAKAEDAIARNDFATAEPLLNEIVRQDPKNAVAWFDLGYVLNALGRRDDAIAAYRHSVDANPNLFEPNLYLGLALGAKQDQEAATYLRAATRLKPAAHAEEGLFRAWMALGHVLEATDATGAGTAYGQAARLAPKDPAPRLAAAALLSRTGDLTGAETQYQAALQLDPKSAEALTGLVNLAIQQKKLPEAETALRKLLEVDPKNNAARVQLVRVLVEEKRETEAAAELETALAAVSADDPSRWSALRELAGIHALARQYDKAATEYKQLVVHDARDAQAHYALGSVLLQLHRFADAQNEFMAAVNINPKDADALRMLAFSASENKQYVLCIQAVDAAAKLAGESPATYYLRATAYDYLHDWKTAAENYRAFLDTPGPKSSDDIWKVRHRLIAIDPDNKTEKKKK